MTAIRLPLVAVALVCVVLGAYLAVSSRSEKQLDRARADLLAGRHAAALKELDGVEGEAGRRAAALRGRAYARSGQLGLARRELRSAARRDPNNWVLQRDYAVVLLRLGERVRASERMRRARALNPRMPLPPGFAASREP